MKANIAFETEIMTDQWTGYKPLKEDFKNICQEPSGKKGENFSDLQRAIMGFKGRLRGIHHHATPLQAYIDEYTYRFKRNYMKLNLFESLINRMVKANLIAIK